MVNNVTLIRKDTAEGPEDWYKAAYVIHIDHVSGGGRIKVWTNKQTWLSPNPASVMMHKVRAAILGKVEEGALDVDTPTAAVYLKSQWPWDLFWQSFENVTNNMHKNKLFLL